MTTEYTGKVKWGSRRHFKKMPVIDWQDESVESYLARGGTITVIDDISNEPVVSLGYTGVGMGLGLDLSLPKEVNGR